MFFYSCYTHFIKNYIDLKWQKTKIIKLNTWFLFDFYLVLFISIINFITNKDVINIRFYNLFLLITYIFFFLIVIFIEYSVKLNPKVNLYYCISLIILFLTTHLLFIITNLISFLVIIEFYSVLYYYFFIIKSFKNSSHLNKYKSLLLLYIWNSFLTTIFYLLSCILFFFNYYSLNFKDIIVLYDCTQNNLCFYVFLFSFFWKIGIPGYHWLKLEIYSYLDTFSLFIYSTVTLLINFLLFIFINLFFLMYLHIEVFNISFVVLLFALLVINNSLKLYNFLYFFGYSSVFTLTTVTIMFLLN